MVVMRHTTGHSITMALYGKGSQQPEWSCRTAHGDPRLAGESTISTCRAQAKGYPTISYMRECAVLTEWHEQRDRAPQSTQ